MLIVKTKIAPSQIAGIGLFADEPIRKGTLVWKFDSGLDRLFSTEEISKLSDPAQKQFHNYSYLDKKYGKYLLCGDDGRFFNHSSAPNCDDSKDDMTTALRDIEKGEELTVDYTSFYGDPENHKGIFQKSA